MKITSYLKIYFITLIAFGLIDAVWLGLVANRMYFEQIGHLMAETPNWWAGLVFYLLNPVGLMVFVVIPNLKSRSVLIKGALYGFFMYATYDLTNLATLKNWPLGLSVIDMAWGACISAVVSVISVNLIKKFKI